MPRRNCFEVLEWICQDQTHKNSLVHILSASCREVDIRRTYQLHANSFVIKPSRMNDLVSFISSLVNWHRFVCLPTTLATHPNV